MKNRITYERLFLIFVLLLLIPGAAADTACSVVLRSIPDNGHITIDGRYQGTTPAEFILPCINHSIAIEKAGYLPYRKEINLIPTQATIVTANLEYNPGHGSVIIRSYPEGASVYFDSSPQGTTPVQIDNLPAGRHQVLLKKNGYQDFTDVVSAEPGTVLMYDEYLVPEPQSGFISVSSFPDGAAIWFDGVPYGNTSSLPIRMPAGNHTLLLMKAGYRNYSADIKIPGGESVHTEAVLTKIPDTGSFIIDSVPPGASVHLNGTYKTLTPAVLEKIPTGDYELVLTKPGHPALAGRFNLTGGDTYEIVAYLANSTAGEGTFSVLVYHENTTVSPPREGLPDPIPSIDRTYTWFSNGHEATIKLQIPKDLYDHYKGLNHRPVSPEEYQQYMLNDEDREYLSELIGLLKDNSGGRQLTSRRDYRNAVAFVQSITYELDTDYNGEEEYWKYPIETLADGRGDCEDTAILTAAILNEMGYDVALVTPPGHAAVAIACENCNGYYYPVDGKRYYYLETTGAGFSLGAIDDENYQTASAQVIPI